MLFLLPPACAQDLKTAVPLPPSPPPASAPSPSPTPPEDPNAPSATGRANPYGDLPPARDLYTQLPAPGGLLPRFGLDVFRTGAGNPEITTDLPVGPDYVLGPGDGLEIDLWGGISQRLTTVVDREGRISLPEAGTLVVAGLTLAQAQERIRNTLLPQFRNVSVDVALRRVRTVRVYVVGDVQRPGAYDISSLSTPLNALYMAGGPTTRGSLRTVRHYRGTQLVRSVDLYDFLLHGIRSDVERLQPGDTILVPPVGPQVTVLGMVRRPAMYELRQEKALSEVLDLAGGVLVAATFTQIKVERIVAHQQRILLSLDVPDATVADGIAQALLAFQVADGDRVTISPIDPYSNRTVYLEGHVVRPGKYPYREGMQLGDLIRSQHDLLPEPAIRAELIRLQPPDFRPVTTEFNLDALLAGADPLELQPFDTVRIFGRYENDAPMVSISGEILRPGEYALSKGMTAAALVRRAGSFRRSAYRDQAELSSYVVENGKKILTDRRTIAIGKAVEGDAAADVLLKPRDELLVRPLAGWSQIGSAVKLGGEVEYPGKYSIREGERLSSVLKRAGGFRPEAYPAGAVLERTEVREFQERSRNELVRRIETQGLMTRFAPADAEDKGAEQAALMRAMQQQQQQALANLKSQPVPGRLVVTIGGDISRWENTPADIALRNGDSLYIPKRPDYVIVSGQVYNPTAISFTPGKNAAWYLQRAGGFTEMANKKAVFVVRANGWVVGEKGKALSTRLQPGDAVVVPEKIVGGSAAWKHLMNLAQISTAVALVTSVAIQ